MAGTVVLILGRIDWMTQGSFGPRLAILGAAVLAGTFIYVFCLWLFRVREMQQAWALVIEGLSRRRRRS